MKERERRSNKNRERKKEAEAECKNKIKCKSKTKTNRQYDSGHRQYIETQIQKESKRKEHKTTQSRKTTLA